MFGKDSNSLSLRITRDACLDVKLNDKSCYNTSWKWYVTSRVTDKGTILMIQVNLKTFEVNCTLKCKFSKWKASFKLPDSWTTAEYLQFGICFYCESNIHTVKILD